MNPSHVNADLESTRAFSLPAACIFSFIINFLVKNEKPKSSRACVSNQYPGVKGKTSLANICCIPYKGVNSLRASISPVLLNCKMEHY